MIKNYICLIDIWSLYLSLSLCLSLFFLSFFSFSTSFFLCNTNTHYNKEDGVWSRSSLRSSQSANFVTFFLLTLPYTGCPHSSYLHSLIQGVHILLTYTPLYRVSTFFLLTLPCTVCPL